MCTACLASSNNRQSCARGWRLLVIVTAYIKPSVQFEPYFRCFLQTTAYTQGREFNGWFYHSHAALMAAADQALICLRNLRQTMKLGGRKVLPDGAIVQACPSGRLARSGGDCSHHPGQVHQDPTPAAAGRPIQEHQDPGCVGACMTAVRAGDKHPLQSAIDVVKQMCDKMDIDRYEEFGVYIHTNYSESGTLLQVRCCTACLLNSTLPQQSDYILDTTTILEKKMLPYTLQFRQVLWFARSTFTNSLYISMIFDQVRRQLTPSTADRSRFWRTSRTAICW